MNSEISSGLRGGSFRITGIAVLDGWWNVPDNGDSCWITWRVIPDNGDSCAGLLGGLFRIAGSIVDDDVAYS
jgi:hypothetical protein